jgi:hypothetical protein
METEQWLEEAILITNKSLRLLPDGYLRKSIKFWRERGVALESMATAGNDLGLVDLDQIKGIKERIPEPSDARLPPDDLRAMRKAHRAEIESCRFLMNYMMGATREIPVVFDFQPTDKKDDENIRRILGGMADRIIKDETRHGKGGEDGNRHNHSS